MNEQIQFASKPENIFCDHIEEYFERSRDACPKLEGITGKWEFEDLIPGLSDFDARFLSNVIKAQLIPGGILADLLPPFLVKCPHCLIISPKQNGRFNKTMVGRISVSGIFVYLSVNRISVSQLFVDTVPCFLVYAVPCAVLEQKNIRIVHASVYKSGHGNRMD